VWREDSSRASGHTNMPTPCSSSAARLPAAQSRLHRRLCPTLTKHAASLLCRRILGLLLAGLFGAAGGTAHLAARKHNGQRASSGALCTPVQAVHGQSKCEPNGRQEHLLRQGRTSSRASSSPWSAGPRSVHDAVGHPPTPAPTSKARSASSTLSEGPTTATSAVVSNPLGAAGAKECASKGGDACKIRVGTLALQGAVRNATTLVSQFACQHVVAKLLREQRQQAALQEGIGQDGL
jgi:hypothetical protein